jgi:hypothetical protein
MRLRKRDGIFARCLLYVLMDWWTGMSGPLSILFAALAFFNAFSSRKEFVFLAFVALVVMVGRLTYKSISRFKITTVSESERSSAINFWKSRNDRALFYQVRVDLLGKGSVQNCRARLLKIQRAEDVRWDGQAIELAFSPSDAPDAFSKTLNDGVPEFIDVVILSSDGDLVLGNKGWQWTYLPPLQEIFNERGEYFITIALRGGSGATCEARLRFVWKEWNTSILEVTQHL